MASSSGNTIYHGDEPCGLYNCQNKAYFKCKKRDGTKVLTCGVHKKNNDIIYAKELPRRSAPSAAARKLKLQEDRDLEVEKAAEKNRASPTIGGTFGAISLYKMRMMKSIDYHKGYRYIFPNRKHGNRKDGYGCPSLSPMNLGPINHNMPNLPPSITLENYHQFSKVFPSEIDEDGKMTTCMEERRAAYLNKEGIRHKPAAAGKNKPLFSAYFTASGEMRKFTYIQSRWFYCYWYARLAVKEADFKALCEMNKNGYNLCICGYDAPIITPRLKTKLWDAYNDESNPFGHELVLYSLLFWHEDHTKNELPWVRYYNENIGLYKEFLEMFEKNQNQ